MKYQLLLTLAVLAYSSSARAELGCVSKSYKLKKDFDHKRYHYVTCDCPCKQYSHYFHKGYRCSKCGHAHDPQLTAFVRKNYSTAGAAAYNPINWDLARALAHAPTRGRGAFCCKTDCASITDTHQ